MLWNLSPPGDAPKGLRLLFDRTVRQNWRSGRELNIQEQPIWRCTLQCEHRSIFRQTTGGTKSGGRNSFFNRTHFTHHTPEASPPTWSHPPSLTSVQPPFNYLSSYSVSSSHQPIFTKRIGVKFEYLQKQNLGLKGRNTCTASALGKQKIVTHVPV